MTKEQRAGAMIWAAKWWQNESCCSLHGTIPDTVHELLCTVEVEAGVRGWLIWASAALSEVGALGFQAAVV